jgi:AP-1 complex subunit mu
VFKDYFGELEEESIRDNFVVVYELLDETMDFGYPQTCESKILREYVALHGACLTSCLEERGLWIVGSAAL